MPDYKVTIEGAEAIPVRAQNVAAARNHAVKEKVKVEKLTTEDAMEFGRKGIPISVAGDDAEEPPVPAGSDADTDKGSDSEKGGDAAE